MPVRLLLLLLWFSASTLLVHGLHIKTEDKTVKTLTCFCTQPTCFPTKICRTNRTCYVEQINKKNSIARVSWGCLYEDSSLVCDKRLQGAETMVHCCDNENFCNNATISLDSLQESLTISKEPSVDYGNIKKAAPAPPGIFTETMSATKEGTYERVVVARTGVLLPILSVTVIVVTIIMTYGIYVLWIQMKYFKLLVRQAEATEETEEKTAPVCEALTKDSAGEGCSASHAADISQKEKEEQFKKAIICLQRIYSQ